MRRLILTADVDGDGGCGDGAIDARTRVLQPRLEAPTTSPKPPRRVRKSQQEEQEVDQVGHGQCKQGCEDRLPRLRRSRRPKVGAAGGMDGSDRLPLFCRMVF